jgi:AraC-like DNA-binding protein
MRIMVSVIGDGSREFTVPAATVSSAGERIEVAETRVEVPPEIQRLQAFDLESSHFASRYLAYRRRLQFVSDDPANRCDTYYLSPWMVMTVVDVACSERFESPLRGKDIVEFHFRMSGIIELVGSWGECRLVEPSCLVWYQPNGCNDASERLGASGSGREIWVSLYCDRTWLEEMHHGAGATELESILYGDDTEAPVPRFRANPQIGATIPILRDIVRAHRGDPLHWLYASAKASELLYATLSNVSAFARQDGRRLKLTARDRQQLHMVRDALAAECASPPSLPVLARRAGMNNSKLCFGFRLLFGETTSDFVRRQRLELARELLRISDLQVQQIAQRAGYAHHGSFTAAFTRQFGYAPKELRRQPSSARARKGSSKADGS